ncbi:hypothetical protein [Streptomyces sp. NPDC005507]|uniref:hypothetical protein n=1 Tax=Streptomyces sp. NPDC005507 TaxID=3154885 RepID=UPI0033ACC8A9
MSEQPLSHHSNPLPADVVDLVTAVVGALDLPLPATTDADERTYHRLLGRRAIAVFIALSTLLKFHSDGVGNDAEWIRTRIAELPVTYEVFVPVQERGAG